MRPRRTYPPRPRVYFRDEAEARAFHLYLTRQGHPNRLTDDGSGPVVEAIWGEQDAMSEWHRRWLTERAQARLAGEPDPPNVLTEAFLEGADLR